MKLYLAILIAALATLLVIKSEAKIDDFQSMIVESQESKKDLMQKLKQNVDTNEITQEQSIKHNEKVVLQETETEVKRIETPSNGLQAFYLKNRAAKAHSKTTTEESTRVSEELEESGH